MKIGPYEIVGALGQGAKGVVYRARSPAGDEVAIKVLRAFDDEGLARFERERRLLETFTAQEGFVPLLDSGRVASGPYLVMPVIAGGTLRDRLARGPLGVAETIELGRSLAGALARAHAKAIVHRDLKPENVLFDQDRPLVADLGLGKHFDKEAPGASRSLSVSGTGHMRGTFGYMPREQMTDAKSVGPPADVFAIGAILYECLAGRPAFAGNTVVQVLTNVTSGAFEPLSRACPAAPKWLAAAIERALAPSPGDRFEDAAALLRALAPARSRTAPVLVAVVALGAAAALALARPAPPPPAPVVPAPAPPPPPRIPEEPPEIRDLRAQAAQGNADAMQRLGERFNAGLDVARDDAEAVRWFRRAADAGYPTAMLKLGEILIYGDAAIRNEEEGVLWVKKAVAAGNDLAPVLLAELRAEGRGMARDREGAVRDLRTIAETGKALAILRLANLLAESHTAEGDEEAVVWLKRGALAGDGWCMETLGEMLTEGRGAPKDAAEAARWFRRSAQGGNQTAMVRFGRALQEGVLGHPDDAQAVEWFRKATQGGNEAGMVALGDAYRDGRGVAKDVEEAVRWYRRAVERSGNAEAKAALHGLGRD